MWCISVCTSGAVWREASMVGYADYRVRSCKLYYFVYGKKQQKPYIEVRKMSAPCNISSSFSENFYAVSDISVTFGFYYVLINRQLPWNSTKVYLYVLKNRTD